MLKSNNLAIFYCAKILVIHSHLCIKNTKQIHGELTELWQFYCQHQIELFFLVRQSHVQKTVIKIKIYQNNLLKQYPVAYLKTQRVLWVCVQWDHSLCPMVETALRMLSWGLRLCSVVDIISAVYLNQFTSFNCISNCLVNFHVRCFRQSAHHHFTVRLFGKLASCNFNYISWDYYKVLKTLRTRY